MAIARINRFRAKPGLEANLRQFLGEVIETVRSSTGCRSVQFLEALDEPDQLAIVEVWDSVDAHQAAAKVIPPERLEAVRPLLAEPPAGSYYRIIRAG
jgi:quinol monooxygenase YgiN